MSQRDTPEERSSLLCEEVTPFVEDRPRMAGEALVWAVDSQVFGVRLGCVAAGEGNRAVRGGRVYVQEGFSGFSKSWVHPRSETSRSESRVERSPVATRRLRQTHKGRGPDTARPLPILLRCGTLTCPILLPSRRPRRNAHQATPRSDRPPYHLTTDRCPSGGSETPDPCSHPR
jgi:hypothetical protein